MTFLHDSILGVLDLLVWHFRDLRLRLDDSARLIMDCFVWLNSTKKWNWQSENKWMFPKMPAWSLLVVVNMVLSDKVGLCAILLVTTISTIIIPVATNPFMTYTKSIGAFKLVFFVRTVDRCFRDISFWTRCLSADKEAVFVIAAARIPSVVVP